ncbi:MAG: hypothetical protein WCK02_04515 [Bacteroidota bacterium]
MRKYIKHIILFFAAISFAHSYAQTNDSTRNDKISIGISTGLAVFKGDVLSSNLTQKFNQRLASQFFIFEHRIGSSFNVGFALLSGTLYGEGLASNSTINFKAPFSISKLHVNYDFSKFLNTDKKFIIQPIIGTGIGMLSFRNYGDLKDANGNTYYYWSDGKAHNLPQNSSNSASAVVLKRDYTYETSLRDLDIDKVGKYRQYSLVIPIELGAKINVSQRFSIRIGAQYLITFSDYIDNISENSIGTRKGKSGNDKIINYYVGAFYNFNFKKSFVGDTIEYKTPMIAENKTEVKTEVKAETKIEVKTKTEVKTEAKTEIKTENKNEVKAENKTEKTENKKEEKTEAKKENKVKAEDKTKKETKEIPQPKPKKPNLPKNMVAFDLNNNDKIDRDEVDKAIEDFFDKKSLKSKDVEGLIKYFKNQK